MAGNEVKVAEVFYSVQGEIDVGKPSVFIRLSGCNLIQQGRRCGWCDSAYAEEGKMMPIEEVVKMVNQYNCREVVITGGEPTHQLDGLGKLVSALNIYNLSLETNGTCYTEDMKHFSHINCSPKRQGLVLGVLQRVNMLPQSRFKFVYEKKDDLWFEEVIKRVGMDKRKVWIMPQGKTREEQIALSPEVVEFCKEKGYNFAIRAHTMIWSNTRGK